MITLFKDDLYLIQERKTKKDIKRYINLNAFSSWHYTIKSKVKKQYSEMLLEKLIESSQKTFEPDDELSITFTHYGNGKASNYDLDNLCCILCKYFCDVLTNNNYIEDDTIKVIQEIKFVYGGTRLEKQIEIDIEVLKNK